MTRGPNDGIERIEKTPGTCGGNARIRGTRIAVWGLVECRRLGMSDEVILRNYPHLTSADLSSAWAYADEHANEIERALWLNEAVMIEHDGVHTPEDLVARGRHLGFSDEEICEAFEPPLSMAGLWAKWAVRERHLPS